MVTWKPADLHESCGSDDDDDDDDDVRSPPEILKTP